MMAPARRVVVLGFIGLVAITGCGGGSHSAGPASGASNATSSTDAQAFCAAMRKVGTSGASPQDLESAYAQAETSAPSEVRADVAVFVANARAVSAAFEAAGGPSASVDVSSIVGGLTAEQQQFVEDLASATQTGVTPQNATGRVVSYVQQNCLSPSSTFSTVASSIN